MCRVWKEKKQVENLLKLAGVLLLIDVFNNALVIDVKSLWLLFEVVQILATRFTPENLVADFLHFLFVAEVAFDSGENAGLDFL